MAKEATEQSNRDSDAPALEGGAYEIIRTRLQKQGKDLRERLDKLNHARQEVFGSVEFSLLSSERITTANNCTARDLVALPGNRFIFGYNVHMGLKSQVEVKDVFAVYSYDASSHSFQSLALDIIDSEEFLTDFNYLYRYYKETVFVKFMVLGPHLYMAFRISADVRDIKTFKWLIEEDKLTYLGNRFEHEYQFPQQQDFEWTRVHRDMHRTGAFPHVSIEDRLFVETTGGDLTIKVEDNTDSGTGIYAEAVEHVDQTLDDADIFYASIGSLILLKIKPYQEKQTRYFIYNEKVQEVRRIDSIGHSCVLLPDDHGVIFSNGYYLHNGEFKFFESDLTEMFFERLVKAPNGEDFLYAFYNRLTGTYILMSYNLIGQKVETPIVCNGYSLFEDGALVYFKAQDDPQKHHALQIWQTPYAHDQKEIEGQNDSFLFKIGNADIVRCMAECQEAYNLMQREDNYGDLYLDLVKLTNGIIDSWFWLDKPEAFRLREVLLAVKNTAQAAIEEFDKVVRIRKSTADATQSIQEKTRKLFNQLKGTPPETIIGYVENLSELRTLRGEIIAMRDLRYVDSELVQQLEAEAEAFYQQTAQQTVDFLLQPDALSPYQEAVTKQKDGISNVAKVTEANAIQDALDRSGNELEMLIDIVSNLNIEDSTQTTQIIDHVSGIYAQLNQVRTELKNHRKSLMRTEGVAQFNAQMKLLNQAVVNYLDISNTPEQCDTYLTKVMIQLEELEGKYSEFEEFIEELSVKRDELYHAFEAKKVALQETLNKRTTKLLESAERILQGIENRANSFETVEEIHGYFASDIMVDKVRDIIKQLADLGEPLKGDDLETRLKTVQGDSIRQLKDKQELFVDGQSILQFGKHKFTVNVQDLNLTTVFRDDELYYHITGTQFFDKITDSELLATRSVWAMEVCSEDKTVYRAEYLAYQLLHDLIECSEAETFLEKAEADQLKHVQQFMGPRYAEGYMKGVHDVDALILLKSLLQIHGSIGLLRYDSKVRACALVYWQYAQGKESASQLSSKLEAFSKMLRLFPEHQTQGDYIEELQKEIKAFCEHTLLFDADLSERAGEYLFHEWVNEAGFTVSQEAAALAASFEHELTTKRQMKRFQELRKTFAQDVLGEFQVIRDWLKGYTIAQGKSALEQYSIEEAAAHLLRGAIVQKCIVAVSIEEQLEGLRGDHPIIQEGGAYLLNYNQFDSKLHLFEAKRVAQYKLYEERKQYLVHQLQAELRLDEFKPRVMSAFVRNQLLDNVYLPLIGDNLAKQIGTAGGDSRTDRMGLLLLISPPGYGKTTLMEYVANRLGITFMKVNGPAIGHQVTSLDPSEAPNASAREEVEKLNLAFEMGDNVMIYLDDIQHCNPELLQKFISLCDGQRKIEGVYRGQARTYDLRGKKVAVVMAGNPYTETGGKFQIPDMLANRADTYNLGDIIGSSADAFKASYIENSLTSNETLRVLSGRGRNDVYSVMKIAETGTQEGVDFEGNYSVEAIQEMVSVMKKLMRVRDTILRVNLEYIRSAAQADEYRTEPAFKLQGSYRNMNRIAEKVLPIMTDEEIEILIDGHYENEAQTLTDGAEANLLKYREIEQKLTDAFSQRWAEIKKRFTKNKLLGGAGDADPVNRVVAQLSEFSDGLSAISETLDSGMKLQGKPVQFSAKTVRELTDSFGQLSEPSLKIEQALQSIAQKMDAMTTMLAQSAQQPAKHSGQKQELAFGQDTEAQLNQILQAFNRLFRHTGIESISGQEPEGESPEN